MSVTYEYIGKSKIYSRAQMARNIELPARRDFLYAKFEGGEWLENGIIKITSQAGGDWISVTDTRNHVTEIMCHYKDGNYESHYVNGTNIKLKKSPEEAARLKRLLELDLDKVEVETAEKEVKQLNI